MSNHRVAIHRQHPYIQFHFHPFTTVQIVFSLFLFFIFFGIYMCNVSSSRLLAEGYYCFLAHHNISKYTGTERCARLCYLFRLFLSLIVGIWPRPRWAEVGRAHSFNVLTFIHFCCYILFYISSYILFSSVVIRTTRRNGHRPRKE